MKQGTNVGLDKDSLNIKVGDQIKDKDGNIYTIDCYGMAVRNSDGKKYTLVNLGQANIELWLPPIDTTSKPTAPESNSAPAEASEEERQEFIRRALDILTDADLAAELRKRGYEVKATKTTIIEH